MPDAPVEQNWKALPIGWVLALKKVVLVLSEAVPVLVIETILDSTAEGR